MPSRNWPVLTIDKWQDTYATLHMWTQIVGKVCLALTPLTNHFWNATFRITARGLTTPTMYADGRALTMTFDFVAHRLLMHTSDGGVETIALEPRTVADFYRLVTEALVRLGIAVPIWPMAVEIPTPGRLDQDITHRSYDPAFAQALSNALIAMAPVFERFRGGFIGKCSPVHFFWGGFDLAVTRFSGRRAPERPGADAVTRESYSHEVISHGFWLGSGSMQEPSFYAYAAPEPDGFRDATVRPAAAFYDAAGFKEFLLPYEAVRTAAAPEAALQEFLETTYDAGATLAKWNRSELERR